VLLNSSIAEQVVKRQSTKRTKTQQTKSSASYTTVSQKRLCHDRRGKRRYIASDVGDGSREPRWAVATLGPHDWWLRSERRLLRYWDCSSTAETLHLECSKKASWLLKLQKTHLALPDPSVKAFGARKISVAGVEGFTVTLTLPKNWTLFRLGSLGFYFWPFGLFGQKLSVLLSFKHFEQIEHCLIFSIFFYTLAGFLKCYFVTLFVQFWCEWRSWHKSLWRLVCSELVSSYPV